MNVKGILKEIRALVIKKKNANVIDYILAFF